MTKKQITIIVLTFTLSFSLSMRCVVFALSIIIHNCTISRLLWRFDGRLQRRHSENSFRPQHHKGPPKTSNVLHSLSPTETPFPTTATTHDPELHSGLFDLVQQLEPSPQLLGTCAESVINTNSNLSDPTDKDRRLVDGSLRTSRGLSPFQKHIIALCSGQRHSRNDG